MNTQEADQWRQAALEEYQSLMKRGTWEILPLPPGKRAIRSRWTFKRKLAKDNSIARWKGRFVAKGFSQKFGVDYEEVFSPVIRWDSLRSLLALSANLGITLHQCDIETAFLYSELDEEIWMDQPKGFEIGEPKTMKCRLKRSIYGLKQSSRLFNQNLDRTLRSMGFKATAADPCVYTRTDRDGTVSLVAVYVDDLVYGSTCPRTQRRILADLKSKYDIKDLGKLSYCIGMIIDHIDGGYAIHQSSYIDRILERFRMKDCKPIDTPACTVPLSKRLPSEPPARRHDLYLQLVGCLLYAQHTRPDVTFAVSQLASFMQDPSEAHWRAAQRVLRYLKGTRTYCLRYTKSGSTTAVLDAYGDADWANDGDSRKSRSGTLVRINGVPVHWRSFMQPIVTHSSTEAELVALDLIARETKWFRFFLHDLRALQSGPTTIYQDNQSTMKLAKNPINHQRTKHVDVRYHAIRGWITDQSIRLVYCPTDEMIADGLTKPLGTVKFKTFVDSLTLAPAPVQTPAQAQVQVQD